MYFPVPLILKNNEKFPFKKWFALNWKAKSEFWFEFYLYTYMDREP